MKTVQRSSFKANPIAAAVALALAAPFAASVAFAGSGFGSGLEPTYYANSPVGPVPALNAQGAMTINPVTGRPAMVNTGKALRKFVDKLPGIPGITPATVGGASFGVNNLGQYIPLAAPEKWVDLNGVTTADDYYEIAAVEFSEKMHSDLPKATRLRGYVQLSTARNPGKHIALQYPNGTPVLDAAGAQVYAYDNPHHLGPVIKSTKGTAVRVKFTNYLPVGGDLFIPVDTTVTGAGTGPDGVTPYTQNRAQIHLVGGQSPWISAGTPHQWVAPAGELAAKAAGLDKGVSAQNVPDMADPGPGSTTLYFPNDMSARFMFYQDRTSGLTRLNSYAGLEAGYVVTDAVEQGLIASGVIPADQIPLIIEDKTFVPGNIAQQDAKWDTTHWGQPGDLWFPHVYEPNQDPNSASGANAVGRWDFGPLFWPIFPANDPLPSGAYGDASFTPEAFLDTPVINGTAYPTLTVDPKAYRFRILNASNDRYINLSLFQADPTVQAPQFDLHGNPIVNAQGVAQVFTNTEVKMVPAVGDAAGNPPAWGKNPLTGAAVLDATGQPVQFPLPQYPMLKSNITGEPSGPMRAWPTDNRIGGAPDPATAGPDFIVIGNDGGFLPAPVDVPAQPVTYELNRRSVTVGNIYGTALILGPAERSDAIVDFSAYAGKTLILYNDAPAPAPFNDVRNDYFTGGPDQTGSGGAYSTKPGYGPNTRTMMQIVVRGVAPTPYDPKLLLTELPKAYKATQPAPIVPAVAYNDAFGTNDIDIYAHVATGSAAQPTLDFATSVNGQVTLTGLTLITSGGQVGGAGNPIPGSGTGYDPLNPPKVVFNNTLNGVDCLPLDPLTGLPTNGARSASATAVVNALTRQVTQITNFDPGQGYTCAPVVTFVPTPSVAGVEVKNSGSGYTAPIVSLIGGGGTGATATATVGSTSGAAITVVPGSGYTAPTVTVSGGGVNGVTGSANVGKSAATIAIVPGSGYTNPTVTVTGVDVAASSVVGSATVGTSSATVTLSGILTGYTSPLVTVTGGGLSDGTVTGVAVLDGAGTITGITLTPNAGFTSAPIITILENPANNGSGAGAVATASVSPVAGTITGVTLTPNADFTTAPIITITDPTGSGALATATVLPVAGTITGVTLTPNAGFTSAPTITISDPSPTASGATATAALTTILGAITGITVTAPGTGYSSAPTVTITDSNGGTGMGAQASVTLAGASGVGAQAAVDSTNAMKIPVLTKAEQELFDNRGRYNSTGGVELPLTNANTQTTIPLNYIDTVTETLKDGEVQIWKLVDNGLWTNSVHFDMADVQLINRVGWDGTVKPPASNEVGWKDTLRLNPLEDVIIAMRARRPSTPFGMPQSNRLMDPSKPVGVVTAPANVLQGNQYASGLGFTNAPDLTIPGTNPPQPFLAASNLSVNFDNEFTWGSAILGHSENDFRRPVVFTPTVTVPDAPSNLTDPTGSGTLTWTDPTPAGGVDAAGVPTLANPKNEIGFKIKSATYTTNAAGVGSWTYAAYKINGVEVTVPANTTNWTQAQPINPGAGWAVAAYNTAGESAPSAAFAEHPPVAPTTFSGVASAYNSVQLTWSGNSTTNNLQVLRNGVLIATLPGAATSYTDNTVTAVMTYQYQINVVNALGAAASQTISVTTPMIPVAAPTALTATPNTAGSQVTLRWTDQANNETAYLVEVSTNGGAFGTVTTLARTAAQRTGTGGAVSYNAVTSPGSIYAFRVTAVNVTGGATSLSTAVTASADLSAPLAPATPTGLTATVASATRVTLAWVDAASNENSYLVTINNTTTGATTTATITRTAAQSLAIGGVVSYNATVVSGQSYTFSVVAQATKYGLTTASPAASASASVLAPAMPTSVAAAQTLANGVVVSRSITVNWTDAPSNATSYTVQRATVTGGVTGTYATVGTVASGVQTLVNTGLTVGRTYQYQVRANGGVGSSAYVATSQVVAQ